MIGGRLVKLVFVGVVDDFRADVDQLAPKITIVDFAGEVERVGYREYGIGKPSQVFLTAEFADLFIAAQVVFQRYRCRQLSTLDQAAGGLVNPTVCRIGEMFREQKLLGSHVGSIVDEYGAKQRHLRIGVVRRRAVAEFMSRFLAEGRDVFDLIS